MKTCIFTEGQFPTVVPRRHAGIVQPRNQSVPQTLWAVRCQSSSTLCDRRHVGCRAAVLLQDVDFRASHIFTDSPAPVLFRSRFHWTLADLNPVVIDDHRRQIDTLLNYIYTLQWAEIRLISGVVVSRRRRNCAVFTGEDDAQFCFYTCLSSRQSQGRPISHCESLIIHNNSDIYFLHGCSLMQHYVWWLTAMKGESQCVAGHDFSWCRTIYIWKTKTGQPQVGWDHRGDLIVRGLVSSKTCQPVSPLEIHCV